MMKKLAARYTSTQDGTVVLSGFSELGKPVAPSELRGTAGAFALAALINAFKDAVDEDTYSFTPIFVMYDGKELQVTSFELTADADDEGDLTNLKVALSCVS
jgi:hypothetical protein